MVTRKTVLMVINSHENLPPVIPREKLQTQDLQRNGLD